MPRRRRHRACDTRLMEGYPSNVRLHKFDESILLSLQKSMVRPAQENVGICELGEEYFNTDHSPQIVGVLERA